MIPQKENDLLTQTGPRTPCGELMRRYWQPVALVEELSSGSAPKKVRIFSEDLVLFRDDQGRPGLLGLHCSHRGTDLSYGRSAVSIMGGFTTFAGKFWNNRASPVEGPRGMKSVISLILALKRAESFLLTWVRVDPLCCLTTNFSQFRKSKGPSQKFSTSATICRATKAISTRYTFRFCINTSRKPKSTGRVSFRGARQPTMHCWEKTWRRRSRWK